MARQFDIFLTRNRALVLILQSDAVERSRTRIVAPLVRSADLADYIRGVNPVIWFGETEYRVAVQGLAAISTASLGSKVGEAQHLRDDIARAIDLLFTGV